VPWLRLFVLLFVVILALPAMPATSVEAASLKDQISAAKERQASLSESIAKSEKLVAQLKQDEQQTSQAITATKNELQNIRADIVAVRARVKKVEARIERIKQRHRQLVDEQRQTDYTLSLLEQELAHGEADLKARREALSQRLAEAYRAESTTIIDQVFTATSFSDALTETSNNLAFGDQDAQLSAQIQQDQQALDSLRLLTTSTRLRTDQLRRDTEDTWSQVATLKRQLKAAKKRLVRLEKRKEAAWERQKAQLASILTNKKQVQAAAAAMRATRSRLQSRVRSLMAAAQARATRTFGGIRAGSGSGQLAWPASGTVSQGYGCTSYPLYGPRGGCAHFHDGIDIAGNGGSAIKASADGVVMLAGYNPYEGSNAAIIVVIAHGNGISTLYAHMRSVAVSAGQTVRRGQTIGYMGSTGNSTGNHLHFEVWSGGDWNPVNPYAYLN